MSETTNAAPNSMRRLTNADATRLVRLVEAFDDLQTVLSCCERLMGKIGRSGEGFDEVGVEALWTLALLSYARSFAGKKGTAVLTEDDLSGTQPAEELLRWHRVLLRLRDQHADAGKNPREAYTVGLVPDEAGTANAVAVTSVHAPMVDEAAVRQAGALAYPLCALLDERIDELQKRILAAARDMPKAKLSEMDLIEVVAAS